jgi:lipopolysaccharide export system permease protein
MRTFDRYLIEIFLRAFLICFVSLIGLYIVIDAFSKLDEFSERSHGLFALLTTIGSYYSYRVSLFFDRLAGVISTLAAMFTFSWIQRTNELMPMLAAGVPVYRIVAPVLVSAMTMNGLAVVNQEMIIPRIARQLELAPDDDSLRAIGAHSASDPRGILFSGDRCYRQEQKVKPAHVTVPPTVASTLVELRADEAKYVPPGGGNPSGGWLLSGVKSPHVSPIEGVLEPVESGGYFFYSTITFEQISRQNHWFQFSSTRELLDELHNPANRRRTEMAVLVHSRCTKPLAAMTLLILGLPFVLSGADRRMVSLVGMSLVISFAFQMFWQLCQRLGTAECISPTLAAWLPIMVFGSLAVGMFDLVRT